MILQCFCHSVSFAVHMDCSTASLGVATAQHVALERIAMLANGTLMWLELQMESFHMLGQTVASLEDPLAYVALVASLRAVRNTMLLQAGAGCERLLADATAVGVPFGLWLRLCPASNHCCCCCCLPASLANAFRLLAALELVPPVDTPVGEADELTMPAAVTLQASVTQWQQLTDVAHVLAQSETRAEQSQAADALHGKHAARWQHKVPLALAMAKQLLHAGVAATAVTASISSPCTRLAKLRL